MTNGPIWQHSFGSAGLGKDSKVPHISHASFETVSEGWEIWAELTPWQDRGSCPFPPPHSPPSLHLPLVLSQIPDHSGEWKQRKHSTTCFILSLRRICLCPVPGLMTIFGKRIFANIISEERRASVQGLESSEAQITETQRHAR